jgi:hypothetical protein
MHPLFAADHPYVTHTCLDHPRHIRYHYLVIPVHPLCYHPLRSLQQYSFLGLHYTVHLTLPIDLCIRPRTFPPSYRPNTCRAVLSEAHDCQEVDRV